MYRLKFLIILLIYLAFACQKKGSINQPGFNIVIDSSIVLNHKDIDYYDFSTHLIYLKGESNPFTNELSLKNFTVYADGTASYTGIIVPIYSSMAYQVPFITSDNIFYRNNVVSIDFRQAFDQNGNAINTDPRNDTKIKNVLKKYKIFHSGLSCEITRTTIYSGTGITLEFVVTNDDTFSYFIPDPEKMGVHLYHYFTNGLILFKLGDNARILTNNMQSAAPEPYNTWKMEWLSLIKSGESKKYTIQYDNFDTILSGSYRLFFRLPGLGQQVQQDELNQENGRIWLGELEVSKVVYFP